MNAAIDALGRAQCAVVSRPQLYGVGMTRGEVRAQVRARRWRTVGRHCVVLHNGPVTVEARHWAAVLEAGPRGFVDGASSLLLAGLRNFTVERIRVSVPRGARIRQRGVSSGIDIRQTRRHEPADLVTGSGVPRSRPAVAAVRAGLWARTDRQAELIVTMAVQQGLVRLDHLAAELLRVRRDRRRAMLHQLVVELAGGVRSLGELDVVRGCRERGLPAPDRQVLRRTATGTYYLDLRWAKYGVVVEVDGIQHTWASEVVADAVRHNSIALDGDVVLRLPVMGLRACPDVFFDQIERALRGRGWVAEVASARDVIPSGGPGDQFV